VRARNYAGLPLTLMMAATLPQRGALSGCSSAAEPPVFLLAAGAALACGCWLLWHINLRRTGAARGEPAPPQPGAARPEVARPLAATPPPPAERRSSPRFAICCDVELDLHGAGRRGARLLNISQGGACIGGAGALEAGTYGLLRVPGILLPVPFHVLGDSPGGDIRVSFDLSGLALQTFIRQLERLIENTIAAPALATR
jgi:hypothetical protein